MSAEPSPRSPASAIEPARTGVAPPPPAPLGSARGRGPGARFVRRFRRQRVAVVGLAFLVLVVVLALLAPVLAAQDPNAQVLRDRLQGPGGRHWLGTDDLGRDVLSRLLYAARVSLLAALEATVVAVALGVPLGLFAGYLGGWLDAVAGRAADAVMSVPALLLALAIVGVLEPNLTNAMVAIGVVYAPRFFRVVRASALVVRQETYIEAARSLGGSTPGILWGHVLPNVLSPLVVEVSIAMSFAMLAEAGLSFLGLGVQPPDASWGSMLGRSTRFMDQAAHLVLIPGTAIFLTVLAFNVVGDGLRDSLGRELRKGR